MTITNPYQALPSSAFWRTAVADRSMFEVDGLWRPKFALRATDPVVTYGSCFAQHIGRALRQRGFSWLDAERAPESCPPELAQAYNYGVFSARTGNIYTVTLLDQWLAWAAGDRPLPTEVWEHEGRFFDPFRPAIEPGGFESEEEVLASREQAVAALRQSILGAKHFIFTLGLTERWLHQTTGHEYPMCPGTTAGRFDAALHGFDNLGYDQIRAGLNSAISRLRGLTAPIKLILSVSPVPMTATASDEHVLVASMHSKCLLRAVAGEFKSRPRVDYFPSYEMINGTPFGGVYFAPNKRDVSAAGVKRVMDAFFAAVATDAPSDAAAAEQRAAPAVPRRALLRGRRRRAEAGGEVCEEALLGAFGPKEG